MISACACCHSVTNVNLKIGGTVSHGMCIDCLPNYMRENGFSESEIVEFMKNREGE